MHCLTDKQNLEDSSHGDFLSHMIVARSIYLKKITYKFDNLDFETVKWYTVSIGT